MKRLESTFKIVFSLALMLFIYPHELDAQNETNMDSVEISLLTCSPGSEVYSVFGHTAIRINNLGNHDGGTVVNYGLFDFHQENFILKFIFGLCDYQVGATSWDSFVREYTYEGRGIKEQILNLTSEDKLAILSALEENLRAENKTYRYNFFYNNCTTKARDIIISNLNSTVHYPTAEDTGTTFRKLIHEYNKDYPWARFGEDFLLGIMADLNTGKSEQQFLPDNLCNDFELAIYEGKPLVKKSNILLQPSVKVIEKDFPISPIEFAIFLSVAILCIEMIEIKKKKIYWGVDVALMVSSGLCGIILTLMIFSQHPCVQLNLLILIFNPLSLIFAWHAMKRMRHGKSYGWWKVWQVLIIAGLIGSFFQQYELSIIILALILLSRTILHTHRDRIIL